MNDGDASWDVPAHIDEVVTELHLRDRGFLVGASEDGGSVEVLNPATGGHSVFVVSTIDGEAEQATWLRDALKGWAEPELADAMPDATDGAVIARVLRDCAARLRMLPPHDTDDAVMRVGKALAAEGLVSEAMRLWLERAIETDVTTEPF